MLFNYNKHMGFVLMFLMMEVMDKKPVRDKVRPMFSAQTESAKCSVGSVVSSRRGCFSLAPLPQFSKETFEVTRKCRHNFWGHSGPWGSGELNDRSDGIC